MGTVGIQITHEMPDMTDGDLPPEHTPYADLLRWLTQRLGRRPTLAEVAELRAAQREANRRRARKAPLPTLGGQRAPSPKEIVRDLLSGPEGMAMLAAIGALPLLLAGLAQHRWHDEWLTQPETVQRLAQAAASAPRTPQFEPSTRRQVAALRAYVAWKLKLEEDVEPIPAGFMPSEVEDVEPDVAAAVNAITEAGALQLLTQVNSATDSAARILLRQLREEGAQLRERFGDDISWRTGEPPLGLIEPPPPPVSEPEDEPDSPDGQDKVPRPPTPKGGGHR